MQSCLNQKEINTLNRYKRAKLTFFFFNLKRLQRDNEVFKRAMSKPIFTDSSEVSSFCLPHFNSPHPSHSGVFVFLFHRSCCSDVGLNHLPTNFKIKGTAHNLHFKGPHEGVFPSIFVFPFFLPVFVLFSFCLGWGVGNLGF